MPRDVPRQRALDGGDGFARIALTHGLAAVAHIRAAARRLRQLAKLINRVRARGEDAGVRHHVLQETRQHLSSEIVGDFHFNADVARAAAEEAAEQGQDRLHERGIRRAQGDRSAADVLEAADRADPRNDHLRLAGDQLPAAEEQVDAATLLLDHDIHRAQASLRACQHGAQIRHGASLVPIARFLLVALPAVELALQLPEIRAVRVRVVVLQRHVHEFEGRAA